MTYEPEREAPRRPSRWPAVVRVLGFSIIAGSLIQIFLPAATQDGLFLRFGIVPSRMAQGDLGDIAARVVGHTFLHGGLLHLGMNMLVYFQVSSLFGRRMTERGGAWRFLAFFFGSAAAAALAYVLINPGSDVPAVGASGAICGLFAGYLMGARRTWREALADAQIRNAAFWFLAINVGLAGIASVTGFLPIAWEAHLGGFFAGLALFPLLAPKRPAPRGPWG